MYTDEVTLYKQAKTGALNLWSISVQDWVIHIRYGVVGGALQTQTEQVPVGKASRSRREQLISRVKSRINKQLDKGYKRTQTEARSEAGLDASGQAKPMLALPIKRVSTIDWSSAFMQLKYDGHRMLVEKSENGRLFAYSRQGKPITTVDHILTQIPKDLPVGTILDGELYVHGEPLQTIASWAKREQPASRRLVYIIFDVIQPAPFNARHAWIQSKFSAVADAPILLAPTTRARQEQLGENLKRAKKEGYEGLILRHGPKGYEVGYRSSSLVKIKETFDGEFKCLDITPSRDGWGVLTLITQEGKVFGASAPGTVEQKVEALRNRDKYIGKYVTLEYSVLTKDNIPFHPVALRWRTDI